ncbi:MAG: hypothetical protein ACKOCT_13575, partial [Alphaproteobacteria bacterium]
VDRERARAATRAATEAARARFRATNPPGYRASRHVGLVAAFVAAGIVATLPRAWPFVASDLAWLAGLLVLLVLGEYASHRWAMHVDVFPHAVHHRHVVEHHGFFTYDDMAAADREDLRWVLFPPWALPLLVVTVAPTAALLAHFVAPRIAWLFLFEVVVYYGVYEVVHALAHLPANHPWAGRPLVRRLTHHHRVHHEPALMDRWNFNFVVPLGDALFGTTWRG